MKELDENERKILRELIRNTRISDSDISKKTGIPVMTVNRRRKRLEKEGLVRYCTIVHKGKEGLAVFSARELFIIQFKIGITHQDYFQKVEKDIAWRLFNSSFISFAYLGEDDGRLTLIIGLDAPSHKELVEEFNGKIVPYLKKKFGDDCITRVRTVALNKRIREHHNYLPEQNIENGIIRSDWPDEMIFVDGH